MVKDTRGGRTGGGRPSGGRGGGAGGGGRSARGIGRSGTGSGGGMRRQPMLWGLEPGGKTRAACKRGGGTFAPDRPRLKMYQKVLGGYAELRLHVTCVSEATVAAVSQNDDLRARTSGSQAEERRRQDAARAAEEAAQARGSIRSFFGARGGSGFNGAHAAAAEAHERGGTGVRNQWQPCASAWRRKSRESDGARGRRPGVFVRCSTPSYGELTQPRLTHGIPEGLWDRYRYR